MIICIRGKKYKKKNCRKQKGKEEIRVNTRYVARGGGRDRILIRKKFQFDGKEGGRGGGGGGAR